MKHLVLAVRQLQLHIGALTVAALSSTVPLQLLGHGAAASSSTAISSARLAGPRPFYPDKSA